MTTASPGQAAATPSLRARSIAIATPMARGRCEAIVERLRDDGELGVAEDLVPAAGDRLVDRGGDALQHVGNAVAPGLPARAR